MHPSPEYACSQVHSQPMQLFTPPPSKTSTTSHTNPSTFSHKKNPPPSPLFKVNQQIILIKIHQKMDIDYFSLLPDPIVHMIISHLPFKEAARTSILSTRWRHFWHSTKNIDLDETFFVRNQHDPPEERAMQRVNFVNFIRWWTQNYAEPFVQKYRIKISNPGPLPEVQNCITYITNHREIKVIDIHFSDPTWDENDLHFLPHQPPIGLPLIFDAHTMLESLGLSACNTFRLPRNSIRFYALKTISLEWMQMRGDHINRLVTSCPSLETLTLKRCWNLGDLDIADAPRLKSLAIEKCLGIENISVNHTVPLLRYYRYYGVSVNMEMEDVETVEQAVFDFTLDENWDEDDAEMLRGLLDDISSVRALTVCSYMLQVLPMSATPLWLSPSLANVTHLFLKTRLHLQEYYGISLFLNSCPKLEVLSIDIGNQPIFEGYEPPLSYDDNPFYNPLWYPICLVDTLKTVKVTGFRGRVNERLVLKYLLEYGKILKYLDITFSEEGVDEDGVNLEPTYRLSIQQLMVGKIASPSLTVTVTE